MSSGSLFEFGGSVMTSVAGPRPYPLWTVTMSRQGTRKNWTKPSQYAAVRSRLPFWKNSERAAENEQKVVGGPIAADAKITRSTVSVAFASRRLSTVARFG